MSSTARWRRPACGVLAALVLSAGCGSSSPSYDSYEQMVAKLKGTPAECQSVDQADIEQLGAADERYVCTTAGGKLILGKYQLPVHREEETARFKGQYLVVGPNWLVQAPDQKLADTAADALNGQVQH